MYPFYDIWNAAKFNKFSCGCIVVIVGLISMIFGARTAPNMTLCSRNESMPCVLKYGETMKVCAGDHAYANMTFIVDANISPDDITIMVLGYQFSKGAIVSGQFHYGNEHIDRWTNKISFQGNIMTYEIRNLQTESGDEFECHMEIDIEGEKFVSKHFKWFHVDSSNCTPKPPNYTTEQYLDNITEQLYQLRASMNSLTSDVAGLRKTHTHLQSGLTDGVETMKAVKNLTVSMNLLASDVTELRTTNTLFQSGLMDGVETMKAVNNFTISSDQWMKNKLDQILGLVIFLIITIIIGVITFLYMLTGKREQPRPQINNHLPSSKYPQVPITCERSTPSIPTELNSLVRAQSMLSLRPQDEVQDEEETTGV